ncbi:MAG: hypothetical protein PSN34_14500 [Urechidicola sp.]|nr:hypothetical protein [Urechidicola sp.]
MIRIDNFELIDESEKAWQIAKAFYEGSDPEYRWIPKSVSILNEEQNIILIKKWFYEVWMKELKEYEERDIEIQNEQVQRKTRRELLKKTNLYNTAKDFINIRVSESPFGNGYSNTRTIFYLGEFAKYFFSKCELQIDNPLKIRLQELLKSDINYKNAYDYSKSRIISVQMPDREELTFLMAEFIIFLDEDFYENYEFVCNSLLKLSQTDYLEQLAPSEKIITMFIINEIEINILKKDDKVCVHSNNNNLVKSILLPLNNFTSLVDRIGILDKKLTSKINFVFNNTNFMKKPEAIKMTIEFMINDSFPELKNNIRIEIGGDNNEIVLYLKKGLNDPDFRNAYPALILRKSFFENCKLFGVERLVFIDETNKTFDDIVVNSFDTNNLN